MALNPTLRQMNELTVRYTRQTGAKVKSHVLSRVKLIIRILVPGAFLKFKCAAYEAIYPFTCLMYKYINSRQNRSSIFVRHVDQIFVIKIQNYTSKACVAKQGTSICSDYSLEWKDRPCKRNGRLYLHSSIFSINTYMYLWKGLERSASLSHLRPCSMNIK